MPHVHVRAADARDADFGQHFARREILHIRHYSLFTPRDFDLSPYFRIVKPTIEFGFDYKQIEWGPAGVPENRKGGTKPAGD